MPDQRGAVGFGLSGRNLIGLVLATCLTAVLSLGVHDVMLTRMDIPFPDTSSVPAWARYLDVVVRLGALVWLCRIAAPVLARKTALSACIMVALFLLLFNETLRVFVVSFHLTEGWREGRWLYTLVDRLAVALGWAFYGAGAALIARTRLSRGTTPAFLAVLIVAALGMFLVQPQLSALASRLEQVWHLAEPAEVYQLPYGVQVYLVIYATFIEPTIAVLAAAALLWPYLPGTMARRLTIFVLLMLLIRGRVVTFLLFSLWVPATWPTAYLAEAQFFLETLFLAVACGLIWIAVLRARRADVIGPTSGPSRKEE